MINRIYVSTTNRKQSPHSPKNFSQRDSSYILSYYEVLRMSYVKEQTFFSGLGLPLLILYVILYQLIVII